MFPFVLLILIRNMVVSLLISEEFKSKKHQMYHFNLSLT